MNRKTLFRVLFWGGWFAWIYVFGMLLRQYTPDDGVFLPVIVNTLLGLVVVMLFPLLVLLVQYYYPKSGS